MAKLTLKPSDRPASAPEYVVQKSHSGEATAAAGHPILWEGRTPA